MKTTQLPIALSALLLSTGCLVCPASAQNEVRSEKIHIDEDPKQTYFLIRPSEDTASPREKQKLLLVLPGGNGSADFHPFIRNIARFALPEDYLVAQLVSVRWSDNQQIIWPTKESRVPGMQFSTEEFIASVIEDVEKQHPVDEDHIYTLSWSSGGPAAYAASLDNRDIDGSFIAMSVFVPARLGNLSKAARHRYYLYHSPEDKVCPYRMAEEARDKLTKEKAAVKLEIYTGGHGWHGNIFGAIREGVEWLENGMSRSRNRE